MKRRLLLSALLFFAVAGSDTLSFAADAKSDAAQRYKDGFDRFRAHDYEGSRAAFLQAYALDPQPKYLWDLAVSELEGAHPAEGLMHVKQYLAQPGATEPAAMHAKVQKLTAAAQGKTGHVVVTTAAGAVLSLDGQPATLYADATLDVTPGSHLLEARFGTKTASASVDPKAGETVHVELQVTADVTPTPAPAPAAAPTAAPPLSPAAQPTIDLPPSSTDEGHRFWTPLRTSGTIVAGVGVASLIVGGVFVAQTEQDNSTRSSLRSSLGQHSCSGAQSGLCGSLSSAQNDQSRDYDLSLVFLSVGALATAAGAAMFFWPTHTESTATISPFLSPSSAGMQLRGDF